MEIVARGVVAKGIAGTNSQSCAFPQISVLPSGRWLCAYRGSPQKTDMAGQRSLLTVSDDEGRTWSSPADPFIPPTVDGKAGLFRCWGVTSLGGKRVLATLCWVDHSAPELPFFNEATEGLLDTRIFHAWSEDNGDTWSRPQLMDTSRFACPVPITGPSLLLSHGELACQFELNKHYNDPAPWRHASVLMFSKDGGHTWPDHVVVTCDPENKIFYWDQRPASLPGGRVLALFWTFDRIQSLYRNIHARQSDDDGRTWSEIWDVGVPGQPAPAVSLADGRIGMVFVDRTGPPQIKMRASEDGGRTWPAATEITLEQSIVASQTREKQNMQDAWAEMAKFSIGLPATAVAKNGDVIVVYYAGASTDHTDIKYVRIRVRKG